MYNNLIMTPIKNHLAIFLAALSALLFFGCAGMMKPPSPLWNPAAYNTVAVLPVRMTILTGRELFKSEDTEISDRMGGMMQEALSVVMRYRRYEVLAPGDLSEKLMEEDDLAEAFAVLAAAFGYMGDERGAQWEDAIDGAALIGEKLGADLLVLAHGNGEYHSFEENLFQGVVTGLLSKGKEQYQAPPSFLNLDVFFVDPAAGIRLARILPRNMPYEKKAVTLAKVLDRHLRRVPVRQGSEVRSQEPGEMPKP
jgi:hypothetical protein